VYLVRLAGEGKKKQANQAEGCVLFMKIARTQAGMTINNRTHVIDSNKLRKIKSFLQITRYTPEHGSDTLGNIPKRQSPANITYVDQE
jgi:hypothetical protein